MQQIKPYYPHIATGIICLLIGSAFTYASTAPKTTLAKSGKTQAVQYIQPAQAEETPKPVVKPKSTNQPVVAKPEQAQDTTNPVKAELKAKLETCQSSWTGATKPDAMTAKQLNDRLYECYIARDGKHASN